MNIEESVRKRILTLIEQAKNAESTHNRTLSDHNGKVSELEKSLDKVCLLYTSDAADERSGV